MIVFDRTRGRGGRKAEEILYRYRRVELHKYWEECYNPRCPNIRDSSRNDNNNKSKSTTVYPHQYKRPNTESIRSEPVDKAFVTSPLVNQWKNWKLSKTACQRMCTSFHQHKSIHLRNLIRVPQSQIPRMMRWNVYSK